MWLASRKSVVGLGRVILVDHGGVRRRLDWIALRARCWLSMMFMIITGFGMMVQMASTNTVIQTIVDEDKRGRVMSFYTMAFLGTAPFGSLLAGWLSSRIGAPHTVYSAGSVHRDGGMVLERAACDPRAGASDQQTYGDPPRSRAGAADSGNAKRMRKT